MLIKTFHRSTMTDERLTHLAAMISVESETAKTVDVTELTEIFAFLKTSKKSFSLLETQQMLKSVCFIRCVDAVENAFCKHLLK